MNSPILALDLEGVLITNAVSQFPRPGLKAFLNECQAMFGVINICMFTTVPERRFRQIAKQLVAVGYAPDWFKTVRYTDWVGEHKDLRFVSSDINQVIIIDDYPPYIKQAQKHRLIEVKQYLEPYSHEEPDASDDELQKVLVKIKDMMASRNGVIERR